MDALKKYFPFSFTEKKDVAALVINVLVYLIAGVLIGLVIKIFSAIPVLNVIIGFVGGLVDLYVLIGVVLSFLDYFKVLK